MVSLEQEYKVCCLGVGRTTGLLRVAAWLVICQTVFMVGLCWMYFPTRSKIEKDKQYVLFTDSILDIKARMDKLEQENIVLFRMLRNENEQRGVIPDNRGPVYPVPLPPQPAPGWIPGQTGDSSVGDTAFGDIPEFGESLGDTN